MKLCNYQSLILFIRFILDTEIVPGEFFIVKHERDADLEHFIQFSMSLRGKPAIMGKL